MQQGDRHQAGAARSRTTSARAVGIILDSLLVMLSFVIAFGLRSLLPLQRNPESYPLNEYAGLVLLCGLIWPLAMSVAKAYGPDADAWGSPWERFAAAHVAACLGTAAVLYLGAMAWVSRVLVVAFFVVSGTLLGAVRWRMFRDGRVRSTTAMDAPLSTMAPEPEISGADEADNARESTSRFGLFDSTTGGVLGVFVVVALLSKASVNFHDITDFFVPAVDRFLEQPLLVYQFRHEVFGFDFPLSYPPLFLLLWTPFVTLARALGLGDFTAAGSLVVYLPLLTIDLLTVWMIRSMAADLGCEERTASLVAVAYLFNPFLWFSSVYVMHQEGAVLLLGLLSLRALSRDRPALAGVALGLGLLLKTTAALFLIPMTLVLCAGRQWGRAVKLVVPAVTLFVVGMAPFALVDPDGVRYSLLEFERTRPVFGVSALKVFVGTGLEEWWVRNAGLALLVAAVVTSAVFARRWRPHTLRTTMAVCLAAQLVAALAYKWVYAHYLLPAVGLFLLWGARRGAEFPWRRFLGVQLAFFVVAPWPPEVLLETGPVVWLHALAYVLLVGAGLALVVAGEDARRRDGSIGAAA